MIGSTATSMSMDIVLNPGEPNELEGYLRLDQERGELSIWFRGTELSDDWGMFLIRFPIAGVTVDTIRDEHTVEEYFQKFGSPVKEWSEDQDADMDAIEKTSQVELTGAVKPE